VEEYTVKHHWIIAAVAAAAVIAGSLCGCRHAPRPAGPGAAWTPDTYYLFPGEPAPVEGPQLPAAHYERVLDERRRLRQRIDELETERQTDAR